MTPDPAADRFQLDDRDREHAPVAGYPVWRTRKWIASYQMDDDKADALIRSNIVGVFTWVTRAHEPMTAMLDYVALDGLLHVTSTSNRAKYLAWSRNPATTVCIWNWQNDQEPLNLRGHVEIIHDSELLREFVRGMLGNRLQVAPQDVPEAVLDSQFRLFDAPDRAVIRVHVDKVVSYDGAKLRRAERDGTDLWGVAQV